jgi:NAD(P)-dependent dehydrogenase (short-subunit alcohol dehydrogenase family)
VGTLSGKVVLVTGASSGFGLGVAEALLARGAKVHAAARRLEPMRGLEAKGARLHAMDVTDDASVSEGVAQILAEDGRIDAVFNNAGYGAYGAIEAVAIDEVRRQFEVNLFGAGRVMQAVLPAMRAQGSGLIVNTASVVAHVPMPMLGWYAASKHALRAMSDAARLEVAPLGIRIVLIEPGAVKTGFDTVALDALDKTAHPAEYHALRKAFRNAMEGFYRNAPGPEATVAAVIAAMESEAPPRRYRTTADARWLPRVRALIGERLFDRLMMRVLK